MKKLFENNIQKFNSLKSEQYLIGAMLQHLVDDYELPNYLSIELYSLNKHVLIVEAIDWVLQSGMEFSVSEVVNILKINDKLSYLSVLKQKALVEKCTVIYITNTEGKDDIHKQLSCSYIDYKVHLSSYPQEALADDNRLTLGLCVLDKENEYIGECNLIWDRSSQEMYQQC